MHGEEREAATHEALLPPALCRAMCCPALRRETTEWGDWRSTPVRGTSLAAERADTPHSHPVCTCAAQATCVGARAHATGRGWMHGECAARDGTHHASATHRHTRSVHTHTHTHKGACVRAAGGAAAARVRTDSFCRGITRSLALSAREGPARRCRPPALHE